MSPLPKGDAARFLERCVPREGYLRLERSHATAERLEGPMDALSSNDRGDPSNYQAVVVALSTLDDSLTGAACPLNCIV